MNKLLAIGIVFLLMFMFPIMLNNAHASTTFSVGVSADQNETVYLDGTLVTAHNRSYQGFTIGYTIQVQVSSPSIIFDLASSGGTVGLGYFYAIPAGTTIMNSTDLYDAAYTYNYFVILKDGDYMYHHFYSLSSGATSGWSEGLVNTTVPQNFSVTFNWGYIYPSTGGVPSYIQVTDNYANKNYTIGYGISGENYLNGNYYISIVSYIYSGSLVVSSVSGNWVNGGYNATYSVQAQFGGPSAYLKVYSNIQNSFNVYVYSSKAQTEQFTVSPPYPYTIGLVNGTFYSVKAYYNQQSLWYNFTAYQTKSVWFNFSTSSTSVSIQSSSVSVIFSGSGTHYIINYIKNGNYLGGTWYIIVNGTQYSVNVQTISIKEYYSISPYSLLIIFGNYNYGGSSYPPTVTSYTIPSSSNNTIYEIYYNMSTSSNPTLFGMDEFEVLGIVLIFVGLMLPAVAISLGKRKGGS